jgi:aspartate kinase
VTAAPPLVVLKFGGTSVATGEGRAALRARVAQTRERSRNALVVVSAMGRAGAPYATDTLLSLLDGFEPDARERDLLASCGEVVSAIVVAHELRAADIPAIALTGAEAGIVTDGAFGQASIVAVHPELLTEIVADGRVPVVAGFQGITPAGQITTLGRGGSDTTACALGAALGAEAVEIHTDVDGVMTADPAACDGVTVLDSVAYEDMLLLAAHGSKVVHPAAAEAAMRAAVPIRIRNTFSEAAGTLVAAAQQAPAGRAARVATAVSHADDVVRIEVSLPSGADRMPAMTRVFRAMADAEISLDMFTPLDTSLVFSVHSEALASVKRVLASLRMTSAIREDLATVTLVGAGMHGVPGVMARMAEALLSAGVELIQISDTHTMISVLVPRSHNRAAIAALHEAFGLADQREADHAP